MENPIFKIFENSIEKSNLINDHIKKAETNEYDIEKSDLINKMNPMNSMMGMNQGMMRMNQMDFLNSSQMMNQMKIMNCKDNQMNDEIQNMNPMMMMMNMNQMNNNNNQINQLLMMLNNEKNNQMANMANQMKNDELPKQQSRAINLNFRLSGGYIVGISVPETYIQCLSDEKVSDVIQRYRSKSGDNDPTKKFIFNAKALNCDLTVAEAGLTHNCNIFVVATKGIKGAGGIPLMFTDLSKNKTKEIGFSKNAPSYRKVTKGINIFGICNFKKCKAYKKEVVVRIKKKKLDLIKERDELFCPECEATIIPKTVGFYLCKFIIYGKKLVGVQVERFENEEDEANKKDKLKYFDPELNGEVMVTELIFEVLEYL